MKIIKIESEKQSNGLWGMPLYCYKIDRMPFLDNRKELLRSAIIIAIAEFERREFEIFMSHEKGFFIEFNEEPSRTFSIKYDNYEVVDNILYEFENEQEHTIFLRKEKINQLNLV